MPIRSLYALALAVVLALASAARLGAQGPDTAAFHRAAAYSKAERGDAVLVMVNGQVVYEAYHGRGKMDQPHVLHSGTKSFVGVLAIAAQEDGLLALDERVSATLTEWQRDPGKRAISIRQLLSLTSGLEGGKSGRPSSYAAAITAPTVAGVDEQFVYGPNAFQSFGELLERKLAARNETVAAYLKRRILDPIGITTGDWPGTELGEPQLPSGAELTAREWAKFGEFIRRGGAANGRQVISGELLAELFEGTKANPAYGLTWWLNVPVSKELEAEVRLLAMNFKGVDEVPGLEGMVVAAGAFKQRLYVIPTHRMVVVRFGRSSNRQFDDATFLRLVTGVEVTAAKRKRFWQWRPW